MDDSSVVFIEDTNTCSQLPEDRFWKVMVIDDEKSVHDITTASLKGFLFDGRGLSMINAYSGQQAMQLFEKHPDTALLLVDVVMETQNAGLNFVHWVREKLISLFLSHTGEIKDKLHTMVHHIAHQIKLSIERN